MPPEDVVGTDPTSIIAKFISEEIAYERGTGVQLDEPLLPDILDSLGLLSLAGFLERQFAVHIEDEDLLADNFETVRAVSEMVARKASATT